jgi:hypothetical protein
MVGEWLGQNWVPPHPWRLFGPTELLEMYKIGDSTGRRAFATMYAILNETAIAASSSNSNSSQSGGGDSNINNINNGGPHHVSTKAMDHPSVIDVNKKKTTEFCEKWDNETVVAAAFHEVNYPVLCRPIPGKRGRGEFLPLAAACYNDIENMLWHHQHYSRR